MIAQVCRWCCILLAADGLLVLATGRAISGEVAPNRLFDGFGLVAVGLIFGAVVLWRTRRRRSS